MRTRLIAFVTHYPALILVAAAILLGYGAYRLVDVETGALNIEIDASLTGLLPVRGKPLETYRRVRERFGGDDILLVAWFGDDLFTSDVLRRVKRLTRRIQRIDGVSRVDGLASAIYLRDVDGVIRVDRLLKRIPKNAAALETLKADALANPLYRGQFVSHDARGMLMAVHFDPDLESSGLTGAVEAIAVASREEAGDVEQFVSGPIHARLEISRILFRDIRLALPLAVLVTAFIAALSLRSVRGVVLPLLSTGLGLITALALFVEFGHALNFVTAIVPPVVFVVGFAFAVHVVSEFDHTFSGAIGKRDAIARALEELFVPLTLTAVTTTIGFASLATSSIASIRTFGTYTALGTALCWATALLVIPAVLLVAPVRKSGRAAQSWLVSLAPALARFDIKRRAWILNCGALIAIAAMLSTLRIEVSTDYLGNFPDDNPVRVNFDRIRAQFTGAVPVQILVESDVPGAFSDPVHLATLAAFESWLEAQPEVGGATSLVDFVGVLNRALGSGDPGGPAIPATHGEVDDLFFLAGGDELERFADARFESTLLHVRTSAVSTNDLTELIERIDDRLAELPVHLSGEVTGSSALLARTLDDIVRGQLVSLAGALLVIYLILIVLFGSARIGAFALLPNMLPIVCFFGLLGVTGVTLNLATSLVAAVALGIAVDDTMHFLSRFNAEARRVANEAEGIERALTSVIRPVTFTTAALCCGFMTLTLGELRSQIEFGALAAATLLIAWVVDLIFTPALAGRLRFVTLWEVLTLDLGTAPHKTIPFFSGLTNRQARIAAILGTIKSFKQGEDILRLGEEGSDIHIVIEGEAKAYLQRDGGEQILRQLKRGDLIGEVALFHGQRTANVGATTDIRLLRLSNSCLERIQARYPPIAAQLYHNLGVILADRLADVTERL